MSWRTDFADALVLALQTITGIGAVTRDYGEEEVDYPGLRVNLTDETYERTLGSSTGVVTLSFTIGGKIQKGDSTKYDDLDDLVDDMIKALEEISGYKIVMEETIFHERLKGSRLQFETAGSVIIEKDYAVMPFDYFLTRLLKTGQTTQYNSKEDDGYWEKGYSKSYTVYTTGQYSETVNIVLNAKTHALSNECVYDRRTGLMWARYVPDGDIGPDSNGKLLWLDDTNDEDIFDFKDQANTKELGGHSDWRVPNTNELLSIKDYGVATPRIDHTVFPDTPKEFHWTSTTYSDLTTHGAAVSFDNFMMSAYAKTTTKYYCRLVRGPSEG